MSKRGQAGAVYGAIGIVMLLIMLGIILVSTAKVNENIRTINTPADFGVSDNTTSYAYNITGDVLEGMNDYGEQQGTIWLISAVGLIIAVLMGAFAYVKMRD